MYTWQSPQIYYYGVPLGIRQRSGQILLEIIDVKDDLVYYKEANNPVGIIFKVGIRTWLSSYFNEREVARWIK